MTQSISPHPAAAGMPGSANLPKELVTPRRGRSRPQRGIASSPRRSLSILRIRVAAPPLVRRARRAGVGRRGTGRDRWRRGARHPRREADRKQTHERTFIPRAPRRRPPLISWLPYRVQRPASRARPGGPHTCTVATPRRRRTSCWRRIVGRHTRRRRVPLPAVTPPVRPRPRPSSPAPSSSSPQRRLRTQRAAHDTRIERELRCEQPSCFWSQRDTRTRSFT